MKTITIIDDKSKKTSELLNECRALFPIRSYFSDERLDKDFQPTKETTTRHFKDTVEADENLKNKEMKERLQFKQWEGRVFGAGYGTGELPILKVVKLFFDTLKDDRNYDFNFLEEEVGEQTTWLLINLLSKGNVIEWGTSSRYGWLTSCGEYVRDFIKDKTPEELYKIVTEDNHSICECDGEIRGTGHEDCGKNPMVNEDYANKLKYL